MKQHHVLDKIVFFLLIIGGLSWGIIGLFGMNLLGAIFCMAPGIARLVYILIGLAALYRLIVWVRAKMGR
jgi:uncharacterized membrane protein YuzA (DUF378 family)